MKHGDVILLYRTDFLAFLAAALRFLGVPKGAATGWHVETLAEAAMGCAPGSGGWWMVNAPPRHLKSLICSVAWPLYVAANYPGVRIVIIAGTRDLSSDLADKRRSLVKGDWFRGVFAGLTHTEAGDTLRFSNGSTIVSVPASRSQIGRGADLIILDDPQTPTQAKDQAQQGQALAWFKNEVVPRLNGSGASILLVMQRLHKDDLCGQLKVGQWRWSYLTLPAIARADRTYRLRRGKLLMQPQGEVLCTALADVTMMRAKLTEVGGRAFWAQYLQEPVRADGESDQYPEFDLRDVYDGWKVGDPTLKVGAYLIPFSRDILRDCFGYTAYRDPPGRRHMTDEEWEQVTQIQQRGLLIKCGLIREANR